MTNELDLQHINAAFTKLNNFRHAFILIGFSLQPHVFHFTRNKVEKRTLETTNYHSHNTYEVSMLLEGKVIYEIEGKQITIESGDLVIIPAGLQHRWLAQEDAIIASEMLYITSTGEGSRKEIAKLNKSIELHHYNLPAFHDYEQLLEQMIKEATSKELGWQTNLFYLTRQLSIILFRKLLPNKKTNSQPVKQPPQRGNKSKTISEMVTYYIQDNYSRKLGVREISDHVGISQVHLNRIFKKEQETTVMQYLINYRIQQAHRLLRDSDKPLKEIAANAGFSDLNHFCQVFKKYTNMTPTQFRQNC